ncbi:hypothetical protein NKJ06_30830 [Mesorhizobium sp. M0293]|uniref:hypothetical protein n=1 Tax=Mesorhizobium sp. M0293 TaxID=2956930 RepID=UPI00333AF02D
MSVRILLGIILAAATGGAQASSLVFPGASSSTPSIIKLGAPMASDAKSVVAVGEAQPDVTFEKVAAIPDKPVAEHGFQPGPMVIRGGVTGPAFSAPAPTAEPAAAAAPAPGTAPATATASAAPSGNAENQSAPPNAPMQAAGQRMPPNGYTK